MSAWAKDTHWTTCQSCGWWRDSSQQQYCSCGARNQSRGTRWRSGKRQNQWRGRRSKSRASHAETGTYTETKPKVREVAVNLDDVDMLSEFSQDPDPKTAQKQISEYKEIIKSLRAKPENAIAQDQIRIAERQISRLMHAVTRSKSIDEQIEVWNKNLQRSEENLVSAQEALIQAKAKVDHAQDSLSNAQLQLRKLTQMKASQNASKVEPVEVLSQVALAEPQSVQALFAALSLDKQAKLMENMLSVVLQTPGFAVPPILHQLAERQSVQAQNVSTPVQNVSTPVHAPCPITPPAGGSQMTLTGLLRGECAPERGRARSQRRRLESSERAVSVVLDGRSRSPAGFREGSTVRSQC